MPARTRISNESSGTDTDLIVRIFEGPPIVEGERGLAKIKETWRLKVGQSRYFDLLGTEYLSTERDPAAPAPSGPIETPTTEPT